MRNYFLLIFIVLSFFKALDGTENIHISLKDYLNTQELNQNTQQLVNSVKSSDQVLVLYIDSNGGDIQAVMELARTIYILKLQQHLKVIVYIADRAIGPAAIMPFLADELYISPFVSWGDIPLGNENTMPTNLLRNRVVALISPDQSQHKLLALLAAAMTDKSVEIASNDEWKSVSPAPTKQNGETLVINQQQLEQLKLTHGVLTRSEFESRWGLSHAIATDTKASSAVTLSQSLLASLQSHIHYHEDSPNLIGHLLIDDRTSGINQGTWLYVKNALDYYKKTKPAFIILELNTPGGEVYASQEISDALKEMDTQYSIPVVCYINNWAISAGAMLAYSCRYISVVKDASMGAAEPVILGEGTELKTASEKINSALRTDFANRAAYFDRNPLIAEAMVDKDIILVWRHGQVVKLDNDTQIHSTGLDLDIVISPKGKLLTLSTEEMMRYGVANILLPPTKLTELTAQEQESGRWPANKSLLFQEPFFKDIPNAIIDSFKMDWKTRFFSFLASPMMSSLLLLGMLIGFYIELSTPGFGLAGSLGLICLILIILSSFALQIASWLELALLLVGLAIILVDLFFLPTFGILGVAGLLFFGAGLLGLLLPGIEAVEYEFDTKTFNAAGQEVLQRLGWISGTVLVATGIIGLLARYFTPTLASYSKLVLSGNEQDASKGFIASDSPSSLPPPGSQGEAIATLRPSGKVLIAGQIYDALSSGGFIERGSRITVTRLDGSVIIVDSHEEKI